MARRMGDFARNRSVEGGGVAPDGRNGAEAGDRRGEDEGKPRSHSRIDFCGSGYMALAEKMGKARGARDRGEACGRARKEKRHLQDVILAKAGAKAFFSGRFGGAFRPAKYLGMAEDFVDRVVAASRAMKEADRAVKRKQPR